MWKIRHFIRFKIPFRCYQQNTITRLANESILPNTQHAQVLDEVFGVQLYKNNAHILSSRILSDINSDWLLNAHCIRRVYECATRLKLVLYMRPVPTKWETSRKISFESYQQIHDVQTLSFKMIYNMSGLLPYWGSKTYYFLEKFLGFLLTFEMFNETWSPLVPWQFVTYFVRTGLMLS